MDKVDTSRRFKDVKQHKPSCPFLPCPDLSTLLLPGSQGKPFLHLTVTGQGWFSVGAQMSRLWDLLALCLRQAARVSLLTGLTSPFD